ncbi:HAD family phosphatase [Candidatus Fermentibacterales bacterium]|nr:HAD family phosphatase [Candidatus Fermentibacterales bacterium]
MDLPEALARTGLLIFDFDGVLADSEPLHRRAYNSVLARWGYEIPQAEYWLYWTSRGEGIAGEIARGNLRGVDPDRVVREKRSIFEEYCRSGAVPLFPEAAALLSYLQCSARWRVVIASNTPAGLVRAVLESAGAPVPPIIGGDGLRQKPAPDIFLKALEHMDCDPLAAMVFEDAEKGLIAAAGAGVGATLVLGELNRDLGLRADYVVEGPAGILESLRRAETLAGGSR